MLIHRQQYLDHLLQRGSEREILVELFGPLVGLEDEWRAQGASEEELSLDAFAFDTVKTVWLADTGLRGDVEPRTLEESAGHELKIDALGRKMRLIKSSATIALPESFPVVDMDDWQRVRHWLADAPVRTHADHLAEAARQREAGALTLLSMPGGYDLPRQLMGDEEACMAFIDEPELISDMLEAAADMVCAVIDRVSAICHVDYLHVHEDFAGKSGPLIGPGQIREFLQPYYARIWDRAREAGAEVFSIDSDGDIRPVIAPLMACGINQIYPMEPVTGMDMAAVRARHPDLILKGGIDKHVLRKDREAIRQELERKLQSSLRGGATVFGLDHRIPNGTPLCNYRYYVATAREMLNLPPAETMPKCPWRRMAF